MEPSLVLLILLWFAFAFAPVLAAAVLVIFRGRGVAGRWLFLFAGPAIAYAALWVGTLIFFLPFYLVAVLLVPALRAEGYDAPYWVPIVDWILRYQYLVIAGMSALLTVWLVLHLWPRWPGVLSALVAPSGSPAPPQSTSKTAA